MKNAQPARDLLKIEGIGINDDCNLVAISKKFHVFIHAVWGRYPAPDDYGSELSEALRSQGVDKKALLVGFGKGLQALGPSDGMPSEDED